MKTNNKERNWSCLIEKKSQSNAVYGEKNVGKKKISARFQQASSTGLYINIYRKV